MNHSFAFTGTFPSRRRFLTGCSALTLASVTAPFVAFAKRFGGAEASLENLGFGHFAAQLGTAFGVWVTPTQVMEITLIEAQRYAPNRPEAPLAPDAHNEKFSLLFQGPGDRPLEQDTHLFEHAALGRFPMFIVPVYPKYSQEAFYEAIFNRPWARRDQGTL